MSDYQFVYDGLRRAGMTHVGALSILGNWECESGVESCRIENDFDPMRSTSKAYVRNVTNGNRTKEQFATDSIGFGYAQWTLAYRKRKLYDFWKQSGKALDDKQMQLDFALYELTGEGEYQALWKYLHSTNNLEEAINKVCDIYEKPKIRNYKDRLKAAESIEKQLDLNSYKSEAKTDMTIPEKAVAWAIKTANDNSHGYSQVDRWGPDYDCSSFVITAYEQAGVPVKSKGASYTGNMWNAFVACGFVDVTTQVGLSTGYGIEAGDVLLNYSAHTCLAIGNGKVANCRTNEGNAQAGDQSGNEIRIQSYWNYPWNAVLRYKGSYTPSPTPSPEPVTESHDWKPATLKMSNVYSEDCVILQGILNRRGFNCGTPDGYFGAKTQAAVNKAQEYYGLTVDGICGPLTWAKLLEV